VRPKYKVAQSIGMNAGDTHQYPFVIEVVIGDVVGGRVGGQQLRALFKICPYYERFTVLMEPQEQNTAYAKSRRAVGHTLFDVVEG